MGECTRNDFFVVKGTGGTVRRLRDCGKRDGTGYAAVHRPSAAVRDDVLDIVCRTDAEMAVSAALREQRRQPWRSGGDGAGGG